MEEVPVADQQPLVVENVRINIIEQGPLHQPHPIQAMRRAELQAFADANPVLPELYVKRRVYESIMFPKEAYPDVYPPLKLDVHVLKVLYSMLNKPEVIAKNPERVLYYIKDILQWDVASLFYNLHDYYKEHEAAKDREPGQGEDVELERDMFAKITQLYGLAGYMFRYFMFVKADHPLVKMHLGQIPVRPDIFEEGATALRIVDPNLKAEMVDALIASYNFGNKISSKTIRKAQACRFIGWRKIDVLEAIKQSGLWRPDVPQVGRRSYNRRTKEWRESRGGIRKADLHLGNPVQVQRMYDMFDHMMPGGNPRFRDYIAGLGGTPYLPPYYYELLYRTIYGTLTTLNWVSICQTQVVTEARLREIARSEFGITNSSLAYGEICQEMVKVRDEKNRLQRDLALTIPFQSEAVILQPESRWIQAPTRYLFNEGQQALNKPYEKFVLVTSLCADETVDRTDFIRRIDLAGMRYLLPEGLDMYTKEDICEYMIEIVTAEADRFEGVTFDCLDPNISKEDIMRTLANMELEGLLKNVNVADATKEDLCQIINNYVDLLMEQRALKFAPTK